MKPLIESMKSELFRIGDCVIKLSNEISSGVGFALYWFGSKNFEFELFLMSDQKSYKIIWLLQPLM